MGLMFSPNHACWDFWCRKPHMSKLIGKWEWNFTLKPGKLNIERNSPFKAMSIQRDSPLEKR
jgi:hypothetical protein